MKIFRLPDVGEGLAEASIVQWHVAAGDIVAADQIIVSVETAKAVVDIPSPRAGRISALLAKPGDIIPTHAALVEFADGEDPAHALRPVPPQTAAQGKSTAHGEKGRDNGSVVGQLSDQDVLRRENFIIGRHRHTEARLQQTRTRRSQRNHDVRSEALFEGGENLDMTRRAMAENMARAHQEVALVTLTLDAEIAFEDRRQLTSRLVRALVAGVRVEPALNAWFDGGTQKRKLHDAVHVGMAVDTTHGLYVPVLENAQDKEAMQIAREVALLKQAAEARALRPAQLHGATITLSNFGALAGRFATPLVSPPQVAILGAGHAEDHLLPAAEEQNGIRRARLLPLSLSFDHRAVTGGEAARFLAAVAADLALT
ncbi:MAG: dihydrolipoamide acetyltransferase family protein [Moraxellaceae bacterium]